MRTTAAIALVVCFAQWHSVLLAQHSYLPADIEEGRRIYQSSCATCHGTFGDAVPAIDLGRGQFRIPRSDEDLIRIIRRGVPDTTMPPFEFSDAQAGAVVAYLRNMTAPPANRNAPLAPPGPEGDAVRGKSIFEGKGNCLSCHATNGTGNISGPDLGSIGAGGRGARSPTDVRRSLLEPNADVRAEHRTFRVVTKSGAVITGKLLNQDTHTIQLLDTSQRLSSFAKADLREFGLIASPMPSFKDKLTDQELSDIISYLLSQKGIAP